MHSRVKVRTTEKEKERKEKERQEKLKVFKHAMKTIQDKRRDGDLDKGLLELTGNVLVSNPDIYTVWNIRREILIFLSKSIEDGEEISKLYDAELRLTENCLKVHPKSYCTWHHREWVLTTRPDPNWEKELKLCDIYLQLDDRNFHTWDYRRFVVGQCNPSLKDEFNFTTEKIYENFSNYSAWHYRSKMLLELYPGVEGGQPIEGTHHKHELKIVQSAAFTDPDDTSAWFYQRWLLGAVKTTIQLVVGAITPTRTTIAFSEYVPVDFVNTKTQLLINNIPINGDWVSCTGNQYDKLWIYKHKEVITENLDIKIEYETDNGERQLITCIKHDPVAYIGKTDVDFQANYSVPVVEELNKQLDACRQLLVLEPDNKWTLLTTTVFLHCINAKLYHKEVVENLNRLKNIDKLRAGYYDDLISKWSIEEQLCRDNSKNDLKFKISFDEKITSLPHLQYYSFCEDVDLSNQNLTSKVLPSLIMLQHCKVLKLNNNKLNTLKGFPRMELQELHLQGNEELDKKEIDLFKGKCKYHVYF